MADLTAERIALGLTIYVVMLGGLVLRTFGYARAARTSQDRNLHFLSFTLVLCYTLYGLPFRSLMYTTTAWYMWTMLAISMATVDRQTEVAMAQRAEAARVAPDESSSIAGTPRSGTSL